MFLQEIFSKSGYKNIIDGAVDENVSLCIEYFYDEDTIPEELLGVYISSRWDELFLVLNGEGKNINELCEKWDRKISTFMIFGSENKKVITKLKYNVIQIVLYESEIEDRSQEGSLNISRKILLPSKIGINGQVNIDDNDALELPFVLIPPCESALKADVINELLLLVPAEGSAMEFMRNPRKRERKRKGEDGLLIKSFSEEFEQIKEWLGENDNTESKN